MVEHRTWAAGQGGSMRALTMLIAGLGLCLDACQSTPPIGKNLPGQTGAELDSAFNVRVQSRFPIGSSEAELRAELKREHFKIGADERHQYQFSALRDEPGLACRQDWSIDWNSDAAKITAIRGGYGAVCL